MNRTIKFRAWYGSHDLPQMVHFEVPTHFPTMQFTGLHDKDGNDVYEGDILETTDLDIKKRETVTWVVNGAGFNINQATINEFKMVIIGNIWEDQKEARTASIENN
jgi:hypothetical protein